MSRETKFRAWDKENEEYINGYEVLLRYDGFALSRYALVTFDTDMPVNVIIEQYTGLRDKNGKEIYEGDIVKYSFINPKRTYVEPVSFGPIQDGEGYYHQEFLAWRTTYADDGLAHSSLLDLVEPNWDCEVIGNIHESNMEELEKGKEYE